MKTFFLELVYKAAERVFERTRRENAVLVYSSLDHEIEMAKKYPAVTSLDDATPYSITEPGTGWQTAHLTINEYGEFLEWLREHKVFITERLPMPVRERSTPDGVRMGLIPIYVLYPDNKQRVLFKLRWGV